MATKDRKLFPLLQSLQVFKSQSNVNSDRATMFPVYNLELRVMVKTSSVSRHDSNISVNVRTGFYFL